MIENIDTSRTETLTVFKDPSNPDYYIAHYTGDEEEAHNLAYQGSLCEAIQAALFVWGLSEDEVFIKAEN